MDAEGPLYERVPFVRADSALADLVRRYRAGERWFEIGALESLLKARISTAVGAARLARVGFAVVALRDERVQLRAADPRAALIVNEARCGADPDGYTANQLVEAFLLLRNPRRGGVRVTDDRRIKLDDVLKDDWGLRTEGLLTYEHRVRLRSRWTYNDVAPHAATPRLDGQNGAQPAAQRGTQPVVADASAHPSDAAPIPAPGAPAAQSGSADTPSCPVDLARLRRRRKLYRPLSAEELARRLADSEPVDL
jgi:hypothetical protein